LKAARRDAEAEVMRVALEESRRVRVEETAKRKESEAEAARCSLTPADAPS